MAGERRGMGGFEVPRRPPEEALAGSIIGRVVSEVLGALE